MILYQSLPINTDQCCLSQTIQIGKIEETCFIGYCSHPIESSRINAIKAYFADYYPYPTPSSRINTCNNYC